MKLDDIGEWQKTHYSIDITPDLNLEEVTLFGWIHDIRDLGKIRFIILKDRKGTTQITIPQRKVTKDVLEKSELLQKRFCIGVKGIVKKTNITSRGVEVIPSKIKIFNTAKSILPIDITGKTPANLDVRLDARALDLCNEKNIAIFKIQHVTVNTIRNFLFEREFMEVHTPRIIACATEGGASLFPVDYYKKKAYLAQSPQLYKEELTMCFEKVFEVGPFFRAEQSDTRRHLSEFVSLDVEQAFANYKDVMSLLEKLIQHLCRVINEKCKKDLAVLKHKVEIPRIPFKRLKYDDILNFLKRHGIEIPWGEDISTPAFRKLGETYSNYYFIVDWPTKSKAFYIKPSNEQPKICEGFDLMWRWVELTSGGTRIEYKNQLVKRLTEKGLNPESFKQHLQAFDYGMPPHAGWAIGLERLVMVLTGKKNIREVTLYPRDRFRLTP